MSAPVARARAADRIRLGGGALVLHYFPAAFVAAIAIIAGVGWDRAPDVPVTHTSTVVAMLGVAALLAAVQYHVLGFTVIATSRSVDDNRDLVRFTAKRDGWEALAAEPGGGLRFHVHGPRKRVLVTVRFADGDVFVNAIHTWSIARMGRGSREIALLRSALS